MNSVLYKIEIQIQATKRRQHITKKDDYQK